MGLSVIKRPSKYPSIIRILAAAIMAPAPCGCSHRCAALAPEPLRPLESTLPQSWSFPHFGWRVATGIFFCRRFWMFLVFLLLRWYRMIGCLKFYNRLLDLFLSSPRDGTKLVGSWTARHFFSVPFPEVLQPNIALLMCYRGKPHWLNPVSLPGSKIIKHLGIHTFFPMYCSKVWSVLWHITFDYRSLYDLIWSLIHLLAIGTKSKPTRVWYYSIQFHEPWIADLCSQPNIWLEHTVLYSTGLMSQVSSWTFLLCQLRTIRILRTSGFWHQSSQDHLVSSHKTNFYMFGASDSLPDKGISGFRWVLVLYSWVSKTSVEHSSL